MSRKLPLELTRTILSYLPIHYKAKLYLRSNIDPKLLAGYSATLVYVGSKQCKYCPLAEKTFNRAYELVPQFIKIIKINYDRMSDPRENDFLNRFVNFYPLTFLALVSLPDDLTDPIWNDLEIDQIKVYCGGINPDTFVATYDNNANFTNPNQALTWLKSMLALVDKQNRFPFKFDQVISYTVNDGMIHTLTYNYQNLVYTAPSDTLSSYNPPIRRSWWRRLLNLVFAGPVFLVTRIFGFYFNLANG